MTVESKKMTAETEKANNYQKNIRLKSEIYNKFNKKSINNKILNSKPRNNDNNKKIRINKKKLITKTLT